MADTPTIDWRRTLKRRLAVMAGGLFLWSIGIEARLVYLQVVRHDDLVARAEQQQMDTLEAPAKRGEILDRRGHVLAFSVDAESVYAVPSEIKEPARAADALCGALEDCSKDERRRLAERLGRRAAFAYVRRQITPNQVKRVAALDLKGVGFVKESRRFYPNRELAAHVLGYTGVDNTGLSGIEAAYDSLIKGREGTILIQNDAHGRVFSRTERPASSGASLELTIDEYLQHVAERELKRGVDENRARGGTAVVMDPATGEILALANYPTFNPNAYREFPVDARRNRAVQDLYEPGSTFKIITASAALEQKVVRPQDPVNVSGGQIRFGARVIRDTHDYGVLPFADAFAKSSNVAAIKMGLKLGPERLSDYVRRFGFGRRSSPDFPGETPGIVWPADKLTDSALASVAMGYQIGVTPLQMASAVSSVANGGELIEPRVVRAVIRDGHRMPVPRKVVRRTIEPSVQAEMLALMEGVVDHGTATMVKIPGFTVAGKTGTAAKLVGGRYSKSDYNGSFVGFVPSRSPAFTIVVVIDSAHGPNGYYGGPTSGPVWRRIAEAALRYRGVGPTLNPPPPLLIARREPAHERPVSMAEAPAVVTLAATSTSGTATYPDLTGMSARDALRSLARLGVTPRVRGTGIVVEQRPSPGDLFEPGGIATLWLARQAPLPSAGVTQP